MVRVLHDAVVEDVGLDRSSVEANCRIGFAILKYYQMALCDWNSSMLHLVNIRSMSLKLI